jgi:hypothetical protein
LGVPAGWNVSPVGSQVRVRFHPPICAVAARASTSLTTAASSRASFAYTWRENPASAWPTIRASVVVGSSRPLTPPTRELPRGQRPRV